MGRLIDLTSQVEVIPDSIIKYGVEISGIFCSVDTSFGRGLNIECNGELKGKELKESIDVKCVAYDDRGRVLGECAAYFNHEAFNEYDTFSLSFYTRIKPYTCRILILKR